MVITIDYYLDIHNRLYLAEYIYISILKSFLGLMHLSVHGETLYGFYEERSLWSRDCQKKVYKTFEFLLSVFNITFLTVC